MIKVPKSLLQKGLSASAFKINICMRSKGINFCWKIKDIVVLSELSERTVREELKKMIQANLIVCKPVIAPTTGNKINLYKCVYDRSNHTITKKAKRRNKYSAKKLPCSCAVENE